MMCGYAKKTRHDRCVCGIHHYTEDTPNHQKQDFWLGQVTDTNTSERTLSILMFHTSKLRNGDIRLGTQGATYGKWRQSPNRCDIPLSRVLDVVEKLTAGGRIAKRHVRYIMDAKKLKMEDEWAAVAGSAETSAQINYCDGDDRSAVAALGVEEGSSSSSSSSSCSSSSSPSSCSSSDKSDWSDDNSLKKRKKGKQKRNRTGKNKSLS